jgi:hypothetical protein
MKKAVAIALLLVALPLAAGTINNDDSCDIGAYPAATLLLPYFVVNLGTAGAGETTIFSVTNVSPVPQIARVTLWTDWAFPVLSFNLFLTGYDVQPVNLYDVILRGLIASTSAESPNPRNNPTPGTTPLTNLANPKFLPSAATECASGRLPGQLPPALSTDVRAIFATGRSTGRAISCPDPTGFERQVGGNHGGLVAIGYVTIDVVATCSPLLPSDARYWSEILYDNVLTGDWQIIDSNPTSGNYAGGNPMVHLRAIPEDGAPALPKSFYEHFTNADRRQPLPSVFAARWISGSNAAFDTQYKIWREASTGIGASCDRYPQQASIPVTEIVRFDEHENATVGSPSLIPEDPRILMTPAAIRVPVSYTPLFPAAPAVDNGGWMYFNFGQQSWVTVAMYAEGRFAVESDATSLGNGCSTAAPLTKDGPIGPR